MQPVKIPPTPRELKSGAVFASIAHALGVVRFPSVSHEQSWEGNNYNIQDSAGSRGTVTFTVNCVIGAFFAPSSPRSKADARLSLEDRLRGMPLAALDLATTETTQYLVQEVGGQPYPVVTSAFWGTDLNCPLCAAEDWDQVLAHGAFLLRNQFLAMDDAVVAWRRRYDLTALEIEFAKSLAYQRLADPFSVIRLKCDDLPLLTAVVASEQGFVACREALAEIGIELR